MDQELVDAAACVPAVLHVHSSDCSNCLHEMKLWLPSQN